MSSTRPSWRMLTLMESRLWWWWDNTPLEKPLLSSKLSSEFFHSTFSKKNRYILEQEYPGMRIGPEPTTDTFHIIDYGELSKQYCIALDIYLNIKKVSLERYLAMFWQWIPRNHLHNWNNLVDHFWQGIKLSHHYPWKTTFLIRFECSTARSSVLDSLYMLDTPGTWTLQNTFLAKEWWIRTYFRYPGWRKADTEQRIWLHCCPEVVCRKGWQDHPPFWCPQAGHLWWIQNCCWVH